jgi:spore coat polysaccharide biosynthesis protein SpsF
MNVGPPVLLRCDGFHDIGLGHVARCLALAEELKTRRNCRVTFAMRNGTLGMEVVRREGYPVAAPDEVGERFDYSAWMLDVIGKAGARAVVLDVRDDLPRGALDDARRRGILIVTIDDPSDRRLAADLAFYPPVPQLHRMKWEGFTGKLYSGWEWVVLRKEFADRPPRITGTRPCVLVTMGGSDPGGITLKAVSALDLLVEDFETVVVLGRGFSGDAALNELLAGTRRSCRVLRDVSDMAGVLSQADVAVASFGVTAYELAALGVPAIHVCLTEDHAISAGMFEKEGLAINLGSYSTVSPGDIAVAVQELIHDPGKRDAMGNAGRLRVDGRGSERIVNLIADGCRAGK